MKKLRTFDIFKPFNEIAHFCTTRNGGVSKGNFSSFNITPYSGDDNDNYLQNLQILSAETNIPTENFIFPCQTHEDNVLIIDKDFLHKNIEQKFQALQAIDALITSEKGYCIGVTTADCVPVLLFDAKEKIVAAVHAGWRGTQARLVQKTIAEMHKHFGSLPQNIFALIGPSISAQVYEVGPELIALFEQTGFDIHSIFEERNGKLFLDLWEANRQMLVDSGVSATQIQISGICSYTQYQNFFSARRLGINSGRMYSGIMLR